MDRRLAEIVINSMMYSYTPAIYDAGYDMLKELLKEDMLVAGDSWSHNFWYYNFARYPHEGKTYLKWKEQDDG